MFRSILKSKIHRAVLTQANLNYVGSITIDRTLMDAADILPFEKLQVVNLNNGARFETYCIEGPKDSGVICLNGAAARLGEPGDLLIILSYATLSEEKASSYKPRAVFVDGENKIINIETLGAKVFS